MNISRLHIVRISALLWTKFHQNRKDPMREIQRFPRGPPFPLFLDQNEARRAEKKIFWGRPPPLTSGSGWPAPPPPPPLSDGLDPPLCTKLFAWLVCEEQTNQEREVQRLLQSWFETTCIVFYNNIPRPAGHTSLLQVYKCYWTYVAMKPTMRQTSHAIDLVNAMQERNLRSQRYKSYCHFWI